MCRERVEVRFEYGYPNEVNKCKEEEKKEGLLQATSLCTSWVDPSEPPRLVSTSL
jgi:hypothetical protein